MLLDNEQLKAIPDTLPNKLSDCIALALKDLAKVERSPKYKVDMGIWHAPDDEEGVCTVCLAGSVMAKTINNVITPEIHIGCTSDFNESLEAKLDALNDIRQHDIRGAMFFWAQALFLQNKVHSAAFHEYRHVQEQVSDTYGDMKTHFTEYADDPAQWRKEMNLIIKALRKHGL